MLLVIIQWGWFAGNVLELVFLGHSVSCLIHFGKMAKPYWEYVGAVGVVGKVIVMVFLGKCWSSVLRYSMLASGMGNAMWCWKSLLKKGVDYCMLALGESSGYS